MQRINPMLGSAQHQKTSDKERETSLIERIATMQAHSGANAMPALPPLPGLRMLPEQYSKCTLRTILQRRGCDERCASLQAAKQLATLVHRQSEMQI